jgi:hypothetical protein
MQMMGKNEYNLVSFQGAAYTDNAALHITPEPDSMLHEKSIPAGKTQ